MSDTPATEFVYIGIDKDGAVMDIYSQLEFDEYEPSNEMYTVEKWLKIPALEVEQ